MKSITELKIFSGQIPVKERDYLIKLGVSPYLIFSVLKNNFGLSLNKDYDDDKSQWSYLFTYADYYIHIYDWKTYTTSVAVYHKEIPNKIGSEKVAKCVEQLLLKNAEQLKHNLKKLAKTSNHKILENPFFSYFTTAESIYDLAKSLAKKAEEEIFKRFEETLFNNSCISNEILIEDRSSELYRAAFLMYLSSFEGFLNLTYEFYLKPELRTDRILEKVAREQIDLKLALLPTYCSGFKEKTINREDERFKKYFKLVNLRNDFVHANIVKTHERYIIKEDNYIFILENEDASLIPMNINNLNDEHISQTRNIIKDIVNLVLESMTNRQRNSFERVLYDEIIEVINNDNKFTLR